MAVADDVEHEGLHLEEIERALRGFASDNICVRKALCSRSYVRVSETPNSAVHTSDTESGELVRAPQIVLLKSLTAHRDK